MARISLALLALAILVAGCESSGKKPAGQSHSTAATATAAALANSAGAMFPAATKGGPGPGCAFPDCTKTPLDAGTPVKLPAGLVVK